MKISFFNRKNTALVNHALEVRKYDKQLTKNWKILQNAASAEEFETSLKLVEESIERIRLVSAQIDAYVDLSAIEDYAAELESSVDTWRKAAVNRGGAEEK